MALPTDNVTLNGVSVAGGAIIHTEDYPAGVQRGDPNLPLTDYEMPASKLHTGPYGLDAGPVTAANPLPVAANALRQIEELNYIAQLDVLARNFACRGNDRLRLLTERGGR